MVKKLLFSLIVFIATIAIAAIAIELLKTERMANAQYFRTRNVFQYNAENIVFDAGRGYTMTPNLHTPYNNKEFTSTITTNQLGYRDDDASLNNPDVLMLGDSYAWGWGVEEKDGVEKQYEKLTGKKALNMSVPGYGSIQQLLTLFAWERRGPLQGKRIFVFFCTNDLQDNENTSFNAFPYFVKSSNNIQLHTPDKAAFDKWQDATDKWMIHSKLAANSILSFYTIAAIKNISNKDVYKDYQTTTSRLNGAEAFIYVAENLAALQTQHQAQVTIIYIPPFSYYATGQQDVSYKLVADVCNKLHFRFADLSSVLNINDYYPLDKHWNAEGHRKAAEFLSGY